MTTRHHAVAIAAVALLTTACLSQPSPWVGPADPAAHVAVIGDSLVYAAEYGPGLADENDPDLPHDLTDQLVAAGYAASLSTFIGADTRDLANLPDWPAPTADVLVVALGSNDRNQDAIPLAEAQANLDAYLARWPDDTCVVLVTIAETGPWGLDVHGPDWNAFLASRADVLADWNAEAEAHPEYLVQSDLLHHTEEGRAAYRDLIVDSAGTCVAAVPDSP